MPAMNLELLKSNIKTQLINDGFTKKDYNNQGEVVDTGVLTDEMDKMVDSIATGIQLTFETWRASQTVTTTGVQNGPGTAIGSLTP